MRGFLNVSIVCQVVSLEIALFYIYTIIVDKFGTIYGNNGSVIRAGNLFDSDII